MIHREREKRRGAAHAARLFLLLAAFLHFAGAAVMTLRHGAPAIGACFAAAGLLLLFGFPGRRKKGDRSDETA